MHLTLGSRSVQVPFLLKKSVQLLPKGQSPWGFSMKILLSDCSKQGRVLFCLVPLLVSQAGRAQLCPKASNRAVCLVLSLCWWWCLLVQVAITCAVSFGQVKQREYGFSYYKRSCYWTWKTSPVFQIFEVAVTLEGWEEIDVAYPQQ